MSTCRARDTPVCRGCECHLPSCRNRRNLNSNAEENKAVAVFLCNFVTEVATEVATQTHESRYLCKRCFSTVSKACQDLADVEARINLLRGKFSNGGPPVVLAAMKRHSNTNSVTLQHSSSVTDVVHANEMEVRKESSSTVGTSGTSSPSVSRTPTRRSLRSSSVSVQTSTGTSSPSVSRTPTRQSLRSSSVSVQTSTGTNSPSVSRTPTRQSLRSSSLGIHPATKTPSRLGKRQRSSFSEVQDLLPNNDGESSQSPRPKRQRVSFARADVAQARSPVMKVKQFFCIAFVFIL